MGINSFLKEQAAKQEDQKHKKRKFKKKSFQEKCLEIIEKIEAVDSEKGHALRQMFNVSYNNVNIQKKKILGFYGQIMSEYKQLIAHQRNNILTDLKSKVETVKNEVEKRTPPQMKEVAKKAKHVVDHVASQALDKKDKSELGQKEVAKKEDKKVTRKKTVSTKKVSKTVSKKEVSGKTVAKKTAAKKAASKKKVAKKKK